MTTPAGTNPVRLRRSDVLVLALCAVLVGLFYSNAVHPDPKGPSIRYLGHRYFDWQAESWLKGRLDVGPPVPAELLALPDPYDPKANEALRFGGEKGFHDLSLYRGKFYMYWGPTPALVAFLPWRLLTGQPLSCATAAAIFAFVAWLASALLLVRIAGKHFPNLSPAVLSIAVLGLAGSNWAVVPLARAGVWETAIFAACCFGAITWWLLVECHWAGPSAKLAWLAAASASWGLAIGSRPIWIVGTLILLWPLWRERTQWRQRAFWRLGLAAVLPVTACVLALLWHNYARFESIVEFGQRYQLAGVRMDAKSIFSPSSVLFNLQNYFFGLPQTGAYFPFVFPRQITALPPGYLGIEFTLGLLVVVPYLWCSLLLFCRRLARELMVPTVLTFLSLLGILSLFAAASSRYELELAMPLALLASVGLVACWPTGRLTRVLYSTGAVLLVGISTFAAMAVSSRIRIAEWREQTPHPQLGRVADHIATAIGWGFADGTYGVQMDVMFPPWRNDNQMEILIASGRFPALDAVMIDYPDQDHIRFHYFHDKVQATSAPIRVSRSTRYHLRIEFGSMLPPPNHPFWRNMSSVEIERYRSHLKITCGEAAFAATVPNYSPVRSEPSIGGMETDEGTRMMFTGQILEPRLLRVSSF
jgi:hypothetical protein